MSFNNPFSEDLEAQVSNRSQNYKDFPEFDRISSSIDDQLAIVNRERLVNLKKLLNEYDNSEDIEKSKLSEDIAAELSKSTSAFRTLNLSVKELNNYLRDIEQNHEDIEVLNYLKQKETLLVKSVKESVSKYKNYQKRAEANQTSQLPSSTAGSQQEANSQLQDQIQINYEPINAEQLEQQTLQIEEREREIRQIQEDTLEINEIFDNLSNIVTEQQYQIDNIEENLFSYSNDARNATRELRRAERYQRRSGGRMMCCLLILLGVMGFIILIGIVF
ncbi:uncharacterized protein PRCAT00000972001 [Priceomyces carsonii]|uniref:uncharacterized protein n=1 Tax=Priceomyces carsonii TaxID=28549 RepID=UPI002EDAD94C|nr:unnamed protein product [Priceomyces carsonii]